MDLTTWLISYLKWKDVDKKIKEIKESQNGITVKYDDKTVTFLVTTNFTTANHTAIMEGKYQATCVENTEENLHFLIAHWKDFATKKGFMMIFVNLGLGEKWTIFPFSHNSIADPESLETGLRAMFDIANGKIREDKPKKRKMFEETEEDEDEDEN